MILVEKMHFFMEAQELDFKKGQNGRKSTPELKMI